MAKQQGSGVVAAARRVSDVQGAFQDRGGQFMAGYDKAMEAKKKREEQNQAIQNKANAYIDQFEGYVDLADFNDEDKKLVKSQVINYRNEFIDAANNAAKIKDKSGAEYQMYMDQMNDAQNKMVKLRGNLEGLANLKVELADNFKAKNVYSNSQKNSENLLKANAILEGGIAGIGDDGSLNFKGYTIPDAVGGGEGFTVDDFSYSTKSFKKPFEVATNEANAILGLANREETLKGQVTENQEKIIRSNVANILANDDALYSILSSSELQLIPLDSIDPDDPNAREQAINMLTQGIIDSRGAALTEEKPASPGDSGAPSFSAGSYVNPKGTNYKQPIPGRAAGESWMWDENLGGYVYRDEYGLPIGPSDRNGKPVAYNNINTIEGYAKRGLK